MSGRIGPVYLTALLGGRVVRRILSGGLGIGGPLSWVLVGDSVPNLSPTGGMATSARNFSGGVAALAQSRCRTAELGAGTEQVARRNSASDQGIVRTTRHVVRTIVG